MAPVGSLAVNPAPPADDAASALERVLDAEVQARDAVAAASAEAQAIVERARAVARSIAERAQARIERARAHAARQVAAALAEIAAQSAALGTSGEPDASERQRIDDAVRALAVELSGGRVGDA